MSTQFDFSVADLAGQTTPLESGEVTGTAEIAHASCHVKRFLHAMEVRGLKVCKDLQIMDGGQLLIKGAGGESVDFTGAELVKEVELVFGTVTTQNGVVTFTAGDASEKYIQVTVPAAEADDGDGVSPTGQTLNENAVPAIDGDSASDKWYLKLIKADGSVDYEEFTGINAILDGIGTGQTELSLLAKLKDVDTAHDAIKAAFEERNVAREARVNALQTKTDADFTALVAFLSASEKALLDHIDNKDSLIHGWAMDRIAELEASVMEGANKIILHGEKAVNPLDTCNTDVTFVASVDDAMASADQWFIDVGVMKGNSRRGSIEVQWEASIVGDAGSKQLQIVASAEACNDAELPDENPHDDVSSQEGENLMYVVNGVLNVFI